MPSLFNEIESYTTENQSLENEIVEGAKFPGLFDEIESYAVSEEPEKERSLLKTAGRGLTHGTIGLAESVGTGLQWAGNRIGSRAVADMGETASDYWGEKAEGFAPPENIAGKNVIDNPELLKNASWWVYNVSDMVPALAATIIPGMGAAKVAKAIQIGGKALSLSPQVISKLAKIGQYLPAGLVGGALEGSQTYKQVLAEGGSEEEAARAGELMTLGAGALNALGVSKILAKAGTGFKARIIKTLGAGVWEGLTEGAEEPTEVFAKYISKYLTDEELPDNLKEQLLESLKDAATVAPIAAVTGGGVSVISGGEATKPESKARDTLLNEDEQDVTAKELLTGEKEVVPEESETFAGAESLDAEEAAAAISDEQLEDNIAVVEPEGPTAPKWLDDLTDTEISKRIDNFESTQAARGLSEKQTQNLGMFQQELENRGLPAQEAKIETEGDREKAVKEPTPTSEKTKVALEEVGVEIPDFKTTGEAYAFGEKATPEQVKELQRLVKVQDTKFNELKKAGKLQEAMDEAIKHQFYNEALQKVEGTEQYKKFKPEPKEVPKTGTETEKVEVTPEKKEAWEMTPKEWTQESLQPTIEKMKIGETKVLPDKRIIVKSSQDLTYGETYISRSPVKTKMLDPSEIDQLPDKIKNFVERYEAGEKDLPPIYVSELMVNPKTGETFREIRDGHHRYYMAEEVGLEELPAMERVSGLYPEEHEAIVRNALKKGENVPENVLAEYPDLKPQPPKIEKPKPKLPRTEDLEGEGIGEPTVVKVYRGEFKPAGTQIPTDYGYWGKGKYYSLEKKVAQRYAKGTDIQESSIDTSNFAKMSVSKANSIKSEIAKNNPDFTTEEVAGQFGIDLQEKGYAGFILEGKDREIVVYPKKAEAIPEAKPKPEKEKVEVETTPEGKEISVDLTKKEEAAVTPKQQKEYLLAEIDKAIEAEAKKIIDVNPNANLKDTINLLGKGEMVGTSEQYTFTVPNDGEFEIYGNNLPEFQRRVKSTFPSTITSKKFKPKVEARKGVPTAKYNKIIVVPPKELKPADIDRVFEEVADIEARNITGAVLLNPFQNWLLSQDITKAVKDKIRSVAGKDYIEEARVKIETQDLGYAKSMVEYTRGEYEESQSYHSEYKAGEKTLKQIAKETGVKRSGNELTEEASEAKSAYYKAVAHLEKLEKPTDVSEKQAIEYIPSQEKHIKRYVPITRKEADDLFDKGAASLVARFNVRGPETTGEEGYYMRSPDRKAVGYSYSKEVKSLYEEYKKRHGGTESGVSITNGKTKQRDGRLSAGVRDEKAFATKEEIDTDAIKERGIKGDALLDVIDIIDEAKSHDKTIEIDKEGYVTLYHRTTKANADNIKKTGYMTTKEPGLFFGSKPTGQIDGYGDTVVKVRIPIEKLELNDIFTNEVHFRLSKAMPGKKYKIEVLDEKAFATKAIKPQKTITRKDLRQIFVKMKNIRTGQDKDGNLYFVPANRRKVTIYELDHITGHLNTSAGQIPVGSYLRDTIELKTGGRGYTADIGTAYHEFTHFLEKNGILSANDITALNRTIAKIKGVSESAVTEEHRADYVGDNISAWETQKNPRIRRILRKLKDFMNAIYDFAAQAGWVKGRERTAEGVLSDIESGRILSEKELAGVNQFAQDVAFSLKKAAKKITDNPNFVKWFKDSAVVDENGKPLVCYHGTDRVLTEFDSAYAAQGVFWFSSDKAKIEAGESGAASSKNIVSVYLSAQKLAGWNEYEKYGLQEIREKGFDGIKLDDDYVIFEPTQIKSIFNTGAFGITEPDIRYSMAGQKAIGAPTGQLVKAQEMLSHIATSKPTPLETILNRIFAGSKFSFNIPKSHPTMKEGDSGIDIKAKPLGGRAIIGDASTFEISGDSATINVKSFGDLSKVQAFVKHGFDFMDIESKRVVIANMISASRELKVRKAIVESIPVGMMNNLRRQKLSPDMLLHDQSMLQSLFAINLKSSIPIGMDIARSIIVSETPSIAKISLVDFRRYSVKDSPATVAKDFQHDIPSHKVSVTIPASEEGVKSKVIAGKTMPYESQGIPEDQWIITEGKGTSFSVEEQKALQLPFEEGTPTKQKVVELKKWLAENTDKYNPKYVTLYHATGISVPVLEQGLKPTTALRRRSYQSGSGYVYLANTPQRAKAFGDLGNMGKSKVYAVKVKVQDLKADIDQLNNQRATGTDVKNSVAESIIYGGGVRIKGAIAPWQITEVEEQKAFSVKGDDQAGPSFQETLEPVTQEDYIANRKTNKNIKLTIITNTKRVASEIVEGVDKFLGAISTRLGNVSPGLRAKLRRLDFDINTKYAKDVKKVEPLLRKAKKMALDDIIDWDYARKNSDIARIHELVSKYSMQEEYAAYREALGKVREEGLDVGLKIGEIKEYAPRILKDQRGFLKAIGKSEYRPLYSDKLKERADDLGITVESMHPDMKADIVSNIILGGWTGLGGVPATKHRVLKKIPADLNKYYMDSDAALMQHLYSMRKLIEAQKFFGKIPKKVGEMRKRLYAVQTLIRTSNSNMGGKLSAGQMREMVRLKKSIKAGRLDNKQTATARRIIKALENISTDTMPDEQIATIKKHRNKNIGLEKEYTAYIAKYALQRDYTENIGAYIIELIENKEISPKHEQVVNEILSARFHEHGTHGVIQAYKNMSYIDTMGSPISALTQIGDFAWPLFEYGIPATLKHAYRSVVGKSKITRADVGVDRIAQEFADSGALGDAVSIVFKMVGLEQIDAIGKETLLNAALEDYQNQAKNNPTKLKREIRSMFEAETDSVIDDLVNDEISDNVKLLTYSKLLDFQPVGLSEMTQQYLTAGNGRLFYMLKTFTLKQFDIFRRISYNKIVRGNKAEKLQGVKNLIKLSMLFVLANAGADELKDWVLGRKTDFSDRMVDNILRLFGVSKFVTWKARTEGVGSALARQILPPFKFIDSAGKDIITAGDEKGLEVIGSIPVIGKLAYWHMGRGRSKREDLWNRRLRKRKSKLNKIKDRFDIAKDKRAFEGKHRNELSELRRINRLQGRLNKKRERINKLKRLQETVVRKKEIQRLEVERTNMIKKFLTAER